MRSLDEPNCRAAVQVWSPPADADAGWRLRVMGGRCYVALTEPWPRFDRARTAVRGDLAHIALAGRIFVPHYAVPMPHAVKPRETTLRAAGKPEADGLAALCTGTIFQVLDIAGDWAWGQVGEDGENGLVGYLPMPAIEPA